MVIYPDGSKEGHETSDDGDILRKKIGDHLDQLNKVNKENPVDYIEVYFGSDDGKTGVVRQQ
jgi:hypothetical protein